ncbi:MAG: hypothetical protein IPI97_01795 [Nitrosomonas sp.]|nr:hypothetical protein [Nitrosomonas sp.]MBK7363781.1 hypothetical protein [Nitrosomonas sp.]
MSNEVVTKTDDDFLEAVDQLYGIASGRLLSESDIENYASTLTEYALKSGDRLALSFFIVIYTDFINTNKPPPMPMLKGLGNVLEKYRCEGISMNDAFNLRGKKRGRPSAPLADRLWEETNASLVKYYLPKVHGKLEKAILEVNAFRTSIADRTGSRMPKNSSESAIRRHYLKYSKFFKSK